MLAHRGPDGNGIFVDKTIAVGHTRLAIIDLSEAGAQPMRSANGRYVLTYNGEIYNFPDIRRELEGRGVTFKGHSDTEVLLEGYSVFGPEIVRKLNGIFAFCIADLETQELFVARDPLGVKPLYWSEGPYGFVFASELKALLTLVAIDRTVDDVAIMQYLTFLWCPGEGTPLKAVHKVEPGAALFVRGGKLARTWQYWTMPDYEPRRDWSASECADQLRQTVDRAVERQIVSDAPLGAFLSGGLDSTAVVAAARKSLPNLHCFTMAIDGSAGSEMTDDLPFARLAAQALGVKLTEVIVRPDDIVRGLGDMVSILDEPLADPASLITNLIAKSAQNEGIKVLLSGVGGDDLMSGYRRHTAAKYNSAWNAVPGFMRRQFADYADGSDKRGAGHRRLTKVLKNVGREGDERIIALFEWSPPHLVRRILNKDRFGGIDQGLINLPFRQTLAGAQNLPELEKCLLLDRRYFLTDHNLNYTDKMGMAAGVEVRVPLLDLELVSLASRIPAEWKHKGLTAKWIFKESQRGIVPEAIRARPKAGFGVPLRSWIHGGLKDMAQDLMSAQTINRRGIFDAKAVQMLLADDLAGRQDAAYTLFSVMCIELWCRSFLDMMPGMSKPPV